MGQSNNAESWIWWDWVWDHTDDIGEAVRQHIELSALTMFYGILIAAPLSYIAFRWRRAYAPVIAVTGVFYTIPALALFAFLIPFTGLTRTTALLPLVSYTLFILVRNTVTGLESVPPEVVEASNGMGYSRLSRLLRVELPIAIPAIMAGIRIATVSTIGLVTVAGLIGQGGLGALIDDGLNRNFRTPLMVGLVLSAALAIAADLLLVGAQRMLTPWARKGRT